MSPLFEFGCVFVDSTRDCGMEHAINSSAVALAKDKAKVPARRSAQCEGERGLGYGG